MPSLELMYLPAAEHPHYARARDGLCRAATNEEGVDGHRERQQRRDRHRQQLAQLIQLIRSTRTDGHLKRQTDVEKQQNCPVDSHCDPLENNQFTQLLEYRKSASRTLISFQREKVFEGREFRESYRICSWEAENDDVESCQMEQTS